MMLSYLFIFFVLFQGVTAVFAMHNPLLHHYEPEITATGVTQFTVYFKNKEFSKKSYIRTGLIDGFSFNLLPGTVTIFTSNSFAKNDIDLFLKYLEENKLVALNTKGQKNASLINKEIDFLALKLSRKQSVSEKLSLETNTISSNIIPKISVANEEKHTTIIGLSFIFAFCSGYLVKKYFFP